MAENPDDLAACGGPRERWVPEDPLVAAARELDDPRITAVDLTDLICSATQCPAVVGGVLVYFDSSHLTATYSRTLAPFLDAPLTDAVARAQAG